LLRNNLLFFNADVLKRTVRYVLPCWRNAVWRDVLSCGGNLYKWIMYIVVFTKPLPTWAALLLQLATQH